MDKRNGSGRRLCKTWDLFWLDCAMAIDNLTIGICRATDQPTPTGVIRRARKRRRIRG